MSNARLSQLRRDRRTVSSSIYLDIVGAIPTLKQVRQFNSSNDPQKRQKLIDVLLSQEGFASNFYNYWSDICD